MSKRPGGQNGQNNSWRGGGPKKPRPGADEDEDEDFDAMVAEDEVQQRPCVAL